MEHCFALAEDGLPGQNRKDALRTRDGPAAAVLNAPITAKNDILADPNLYATRRATREFEGHGLSTVKPDLRVPDFQLVPRDGLRCRPLQPTPKRTHARGRDP